MLVKVLITFVFPDRNFHIIYFYLNNVAQKFLVLQKCDAK